MMTAEEVEREKEPEESLPVCLLCWGWIWAGEATAQMVDGKAHRECWRRSEEE